MCLTVRNEVRKLCVAIVQTIIGLGYEHVGAKKALGIVNNRSRDLLLAVRQKRRWCTERKLFDLCECSAVFIDDSLGEHTGRNRGP